MDDLWPDDLVENDDLKRTPVTILKEQASLLGKKTGDIVKATVEKSDALYVGKKRVLGEFSYVFLIFSPTFGNYTYRLFAISHDMNIYPVRFLVDESIASEMQIQAENGAIACNEEEFVKILSQILKSQKMRRLVNVILSQSKAAVEDTAHSVA
jgi:hypothetical protein